MSFTCKQCGAKFESRSDLAVHQAEERKLLAAASDINERLLHDDEPGPAPEPEPKRGEKFIVPWAYLDSRFKVLSSTAPVRGYFLGYVTDEGLAVTQVGVRG